MTISIVIEWRLTGNSYNYHFITGSTPPAPASASVSSSRLVSVPLTSAEKAETETARGTPPLPSL